jgi:hypothetical protein
LPPGIELMKHLLQDKLFREPKQFEAERRFCAFRFSFNRVNKKRRKRL